MADERPGIEFQKFVASLERAITGREGVTVESSKRLIDKDTGRLREHDVVLTWRGAHHVITTAVECKDTERKVGVPEVEAFSKKCEKTGINHRLLVSANGFTKTARAKAAALDINCMELSEASAFDWMGTDFFVRFDRNFHHINATVFFTDARNPSGPFKLLDASNVEITPEHLVGIVEQALPVPIDMEAQVDVVTPVSVHVNTVGWHGEDTAGVRYPVSYVELATEYTTSRSVSPLRLHSYTGEGADYAIASTDVKLGEHEGKLVFIRDSEQTRIVWAPDKPVQQS